MKTTADASLLTDIREVNLSYLLLAQRMLRAPVTAFAAEPWPRRRAADLRRFTLQSLERHMERRVRSADALARL